MSFIKRGLIVDLVVLLLMVVSVLILFQLGKKGKTFRIRSIPAIGALEEGVGRAAEMGRPVTWTPGHPMAAGVGAYHLAGVTLLSEIARHCALKNVRVIPLVGHPPLLPVVSDTVRNAFVLEGVPDRFRPEDIRYLPEQSYMTALMGELERERPGMHVSAGQYFLQDQMMAPEQAQGLGAFQVAAGPVGSLPFFVMCCDYVLMGDELFAAQALITRDPELMAGIISQDIPKYIAVLLILAGSVLLTLGNRALVDILNM